MYKSPIDVLIAQYINDVKTAEENAVISAVLKCGINVDKDELVKALAYDRGQYEKGYADAKAELIRCKDCRYWTCDDGESYCDELGIFDTDMNSYCSYAKRKEHEID